MLNPWITSEGFAVRGVRSAAQYFAQTEFQTAKMMIHGALLIFHLSGIILVPKILGKKCGFGSIYTYQEIT